MTAYGVTQALPPARAVGTTGLSWGYDVYGNRTAQTVTAGTAPAFQAQFDNSNRMTVPDTSYDANGNQLTTPDGAALQYDWDNRMSNWTRGADTERYDYHPAGWRVLKQPTAGYYSSTLYLYGPGGQLLSDSSGKDYAYFAGRLAYTMEPGWAGGCTTRTRIYSDRLGTVRASEPLLGAITTRSFYPFGEEIGGPSANDQYKFASTFRDSSSGLDYAVNRYYASGMGRFLTVDPVVGRATRPQSWNRYTYVTSDPVNHRDPKGLRGDDSGEDEEADSDWSGFIANGATPGSYGTGGVSGTAPSPPTPKDVATEALKKCGDLIGSGAADRLAGMTFQAANLGMPTMTQIPGSSPPQSTLNVMFGRWNPNNPNVILLNVDGGVYSTPSTVNAIVIQQGQPNTTTNGGLNMLGTLNAAAGTSLTVIQYQAAIILHELAHATGAFPADSGGDDSWRNSLKVMQKCF